jgi:DNA (cytosine-5)-methyltransferase 3A
MRVLSLFDGMACGMLAMQAAGIEVDRYVAFEIDKYAVQTSSHNFPMIEHRGDVFQADFTEFSGFDFLVGGSPCTYWSIAQKNNRETEASGMGWELFCQYVRALHEAKPMYFIYENNKSMSKAIRESITQTFGFEPICINSALVSAQNRQRLYWVGKRNPDGTYSKVHVEQPEDRGILLRDVLDGLSWMDKAYTIDSNYHKTLGQQGFDRQSGRRKMVAEPVACRCRGRVDENGNGYAKYECREDGKANTLDTNTVNGSMVAEPVAEPFGETNGKAYALTASYWKGQPKNKVLEKSRRTHVAVPLKVGEIGNGGQGNRIYSVDGKSVSQTATSGGIGSNTGLYAIPIEFDGDVPTKAISGADGKTYPVYQVKDGQITIKGKSYPIKLADGFYIIRKLTVSECKRLQTVPDWYEFPVSDTQAYKMLGNGWTVLVICHLIAATQKVVIDVEEYDVIDCEQLNIFDMVKGGVFK